MGCLLSACSAISFRQYSRLVLATSQIWSWATASGRADHETRTMEDAVIGDRINGHGLLGKPEEEFASAR
jgi:hypothetical protein